MKLTAAAALAMLLLGTQASATDAPASDPDMKRIYDADQAERTNLGGGSMKPGAEERDAQRREETRRLLAEGRLHTGQDFVEAAYVFQHGDGDDYLLAHTLAIIAVKKGDPEGPAIAAKTLDRYLSMHGSKQIYGTQYHHNGMTGEWTMDPYDRDLISDALRRELGVSDLVAQQTRLEKYRAQTPKAAAATQGAASGSVLRCEAPRLVRVFVRASWRLQVCGATTLMATTGTEAPVTLKVNTMGDKVVVSRLGEGDAAEVKVATAAFEAMTPAQVADIIAQAGAAP